SSGSVTLLWRRGRTTDASDGVSTRRHDGQSAPDSNIWRPTQSGSRRGGTISAAAPRMASSTVRISVSLLTVVCMAVAAPGLAQDELAAARNMYRAAEYDDALNALTRLEDPARPAAVRALIEQYRALCLLALGRPQDAQRAMEAAVSAAPAYRPSDE